MIVVEQATQKGMAVLYGRLNARSFELIRDLPGRKRWLAGKLLFELSRANVEYIQEHWPEAEWKIPRAEALARLALLEEDARKLAQMQELPKEATAFAYKTEPRAHQRKAFGISRDRAAFGLFLEQGLGKTKVLLDTAAYLYAAGKIVNLLVDAPNGVHAQWVDEQMPIHMPDFVNAKGVVYRSEQPKYRLKLYEELFNYNGGLRVFSVHHDAFTTDKGLHFVRRVLLSGPTLWVIDESSRKIKTPSAKRTKETLKLRDSATFRRIADGTPVTKGLEDFYSQLMFLSDDVHGFTSQYTYRNRYCIERQIPGAPTGVTQIVGYRNVEELQKRLDAWSIRMRSDECLDLPERTYVTRYVEMTPQQKRLYDEMKEDLIAKLDTGEVTTADQAVVKLLRLQQILCGHIKDEDGETHSVPTNRATDALAAAEQSGDKVVVWARFHHDIDLLKQTFKAWNPVTWDGRTSVDDRAAAKNDFIHKSDVGAFIANPGSAGIGLDGLQRASHTAIWYSNTFKASERWQGDARLYRDGQKGTVNNIDLVVPNTVDIHILSTLKRRQDVAFQVLDVRDWVNDLRSWLT